ncbi:MAG: hypothetical protein IJI38_00300, partial [Clostridia bacterium]|nr:hypothetical protein [Clostridia bacterium]
MEEQPAEEPAAEPVVEEQPAEEPVAEPVAEEVPAEEPIAEEPVETVEEAFKAGLAKLSAGDVFADKKLQEVFGRLDAEAVVYAAERVSGEGELANDDVIRVAANIDGEIKNVYVKNARLAYLDEAAVAAYLEDQHENGVAHNGVKLDPVAFTPAEAEEDNVPAEPVEEAEPVETTDVPAEEPAQEKEAEPVAD